MGSKIEDDYNLKIAELDEAIDGCTRERDQLADEIDEMIEERDELIEARDERKATK